MGWPHGHAVMTVVLPNGSGGFYLLTQEQHGLESPILSAGRDILLDGQVSQKLFQFFLA